MVKRSSKTKKQKGGSHELRFKALTGENISLNVNEEDTIKEIKKELSSKLNKSILSKYIRLLYKGKELKDSDRIGEHYRLGYETKPLQIVIDYKTLKQDIEDSKLSKAKINLEIAKMFKGSTVRKPQKLEQLQTKYKYHNQVNQELYPL